MISKTLQKYSVIEFIFIFVIVLFWGVLLNIYGAGVSPDGSKYLSIAEQYYFHGYFPARPYWPPLYPLLISYLMPLHDFSYRAALSLSLICFFVTLLLIHFILARFKLPFFFRIAALGIFGASFYFTRIFTRFYSESLFAVWLLGSLFFTLLYLSNLNRKWIFLATLCAALGAITRFHGIYLLLFVAICWGMVAFKNRKELSNSLIVLAGFLPLGFIIYQNYTTWGTFFGERAPSNISFYNAILQISSLYFSNIPVLISTTIGSFAFLIGILLLKRQRHKNEDYNEEILHLKLLLLNFFMYVGLLSVSTAIGKMDPPSVRLLAPSYFLILLILIQIFNVLLLGFFKNSKQRVEFIFGALLFVAFLNQAAVCIGDWRHVIHASQNVTAPDKPALFGPDDRGFRRGEPRTHLSKLVAQSLKLPGNSCFFAQYVDKNRNYPTLANLLFARPSAIPQSFQCDLGYKQRWTPHESMLRCYKANNVKLVPIYSPNLSSNPENQISDLMNSCSSIVVAMYSPKDTFIGKKLPKMLKNRKFKVQHKQFPGYLLMLVQNQLEDQS